MLQSRIRPFKHKGLTDGLTGSCDWLAGVGGRSYPDPVVEEAVLCILVVFFLRVDADPVGCQVLPYLSEVRGQAQVRDTAHTLTHQKGYVPRKALMRYTRAVCTHAWFSAAGD